MSDASLPRHYERLTRNYPRFMAALESVAVAAREAGPLQEKVLHLVQMGAAAARAMETGVASHARRAARAGATPAEISQALLALTPTIGFPAVAAALKWAEKNIDD